MRYVDEDDVLRVELEMGQTPVAKVGYSPPPPPATLGIGVSSELASKSVVYAMAGTRRAWEDRELVRVKERYVAGWLTIEELEGRIDEILSSSETKLRVMAGPLATEPATPNTGKAERR